MTIIAVKNRSKMIIFLTKTKQLALFTRLKILRQTNKDFVINDQTLFMVYQLEFQKSQFLLLKESF